MTPGLAAALALAVLPSGSARYRFELAGEHVGLAELTVSCAGTACRASFTSVRRAPAEAGGAVSSRRAEVEVDRNGRWRGGALRVVANGRAEEQRGVPGLVPASLAELVLLTETKATDRDRCIEVFEEETAVEVTPLTACARREGSTVLARLGGATMRIAPASDGFPASLEVPEQGVRFLRDPLARIPERPPRLHGIEVPGPSDPEAARSFCGVPRDPTPPRVDLSGLPAPRAKGESCREKTAAWLHRARRAGFPGRTAVGVVWNGSRFVWHAWALVRVSGEWIAVDPSFGEAPARSPRFTVATHGDDAGSRRTAGERILACWGKRTVELRPPH